MKFTEHLLAHLTPEWRQQYIKYESLKEFLYKSLEKYSEISVNDPESIRRYFDECDEDFFRVCDSELQKVNNFYAEKLAESKRKFRELKDELEIYFTSQSSRRNAYYMNSSNMEPNLSRKNETERKRNSSSIHLGVSNLLTPQTIGKINISKMLSQKISFDRKIADKLKIDSKMSSNTSRPVLKLHDLKLGFSEFYLSLILLQNYQSLNFTGFRKILKKHDKLFRKSNGLKWYKDVVSNELFYTDDTVDNLIGEVEDIYTDSLENGDRQKAMKRLRVPPLADQYSSWSVFRFGLFAGIFIVQVAVIIISKIFLTSHVISLPAFRIFRTILFLDIYICLLAVNIYGWRVSGVNHVLIFEIDPRSHMDHFQVLEIGFFLTDIWGAAVILYLFSDYLGVPLSISPLVLVFFNVIFFVHPFRFCHKKARKWILRKCVLILKTPFVPVKFAEFFIADQLNSLSFIFPDTASLICYYITWIDWSDMSVKKTHSNSTFIPAGSRFSFSEPTKCDSLPFGISTILACVPAWLRILQCLRRYRDSHHKEPMPHLANAGKYSTTLIAALFTIWATINRSSFALASMLLSSFLNSMYTFLWDVIMDWGLFDCSSRENRGLKDQLVYRFSILYYFAIVADFIIRFAWAVNLVFATFHVIEFELIKCCTIFAEVFRRIMWNFLRLENEHLNNCGNFRAVRDIFVAPIRKSQFAARPSNGNESTLFRSSFTSNPIENPYKF